MKKSKHLVNGLIVAGMATTMVVGLTPNAVFADRTSASQLLQEDNLNVYNQTLISGHGTNEISSIDHSESSSISFTTTNGVILANANDPGMKINYYIDKNDSYNGYAGAKITADAPAVTTNKTGIGFYYMTPENQTGSIAFGVQGSVEKKVVQLPATNGEYKYFYIPTEFNDSTISDIDIYINGSENGAVTTQSSGEMYIRYLGVTDQTSVSQSTVNAYSTDTSMGTVKQETQTADYHGTAIVEATPKSGYKFMGWSENPDSRIINTSSKYAFTVGSNTNLYANFADESEDVCSFAIQTGHYYGSTGTGAGVYSKNTEINISPLYPIGIQFAGWYDENGNLVSNDKNYTFDLAKNTTLTFGYKVVNVNFYSINLVAGQGGTVTGSTNKFPEGMSTTIYAYPNEGYEFDGWYDEDGNLVSSESDYTFTLNSDVTLYAQFTDLSEIIQ